MDHATGLMWQQSGPKHGMTYQEAQKYIRQLNREEFGGYSDWRLPTIEELLSLVEVVHQENHGYIHPFFDIKLFDIKQGMCWSADTKQIKDESSSESAWLVDFLNGFVHWYSFDDGYVRAVRSRYAP